MSKHEMAAAYRNPSTRAELGFKNPVGEVNEEELKGLAGASDVSPQSITPSSWVCGLVTAAFCPTTACSTSC